MGYNNKQYWSTLVGNAMNLKEVGWPQWTEAFNAARYQLTSQQTIATLQQLFADNPPATILEIGCGSGFWTNILCALYPTASYTGVDISAKSISKLTEKYKANKLVQFKHADVSSEADCNQLLQYDLVICMEVLLHIKQDDAWQKAVQHILHASKNYCIISDPFHFWQGPTITEADNHKIRQWQDYKGSFDNNNFSVISIAPRTFLLDNNIDFKTKFGLHTWQLFFKMWNKLLCIRNENLGKLLGKIAYSFDKWYITKSKYGHSCRQIVIQKK
jgi:2-polyprenyl-3-methyl-5-hydroxy-6-metoxy-1,4-benzoquinol methylase